MEGRGERVSGLGLGFVPVLSSALWVHDPLPGQQSQSRYWWYWWEVVSLVCGSSFRPARGLTERLPEVDEGPRRGAEIQRAVG